MQRLPARLVDHHNDEPDDPFIRPELQAVLDTLTYREREVINLRYALGGEACYTLKQCGQILKITRERVRQIEAKAMSKLSHTFRREKLQALFLGLRHVPENFFETPNSPIDGSQIDR